MRKLTVFTTLIAFAASDMAAGGSGTGPIAEIVTYTVKEGVTTEEVVQAAKGTAPFLRGTGAILSRSLSRDDQGIWTDYILWRSLEAARTTEAQAMQRSEFALFFDLMVEGSAQLRYAPVLMQMD